MTETKDAIRETVYGRYYIECPDYPKVCAEYPEPCRAKRDGIDSFRKIEDRHL